jgi:2-polyprenyl-3-methyl-5-hydroxy-6-metoxy-1,4-benzoquinol methylase
MNTNIADDRYTGRKYLEDTKTWHMEDSPYKAKIVLQAIERNKIEFQTCADIGCGAGLVTELLFQKFPAKKFVGYEISSGVDVFWKSRASSKNLSFSHEDLLELDLKYDLITCLDVFEHIEDSYGFLRKLNKKGRTFIFNIPLDMCVAKLMTSGIKRAHTIAGHLHYFNAYTAKQIISNTGYEVIDSKICVAFLGVPPRSVSQALVLPFRLATLLLGKSFSATLFGGMSLMVTAKSK